MVGSCAISLQRGQVSGSAIALMLVEAIGGILLVELEHQAVACDLRDHRGRRDREAARVAFDDRALWERDIAQGECVEQEGLWGRRELSERVLHRLFCRLKNITSID